MRAREAQAHLCEEHQTPRAGGFSNQNDRAIATLRARLAHGFE